MGRFQKTTCISAAPARATAVRQYIAELGETDLKTAFGGGKFWESKVTVLYVRPKWNSWYDS